MNAIAYILIIVVKIKVTNLENNLHNKKSQKRYNN